MSARPRLGVLGGSFDPPHLGHVVIASEAASCLGLERVLFVPAGAPPHKEAGDRSPAALRLTMTELAVQEDMRFLASALEIETGLAYTHDTLREVIARHEGREVVFIMGSDSLLQFDTWNDPEGILELCTLAVAPRPGDDPGVVAAAAARWGKDKVTILDSPPLAISSSGLRARVAAGRPIRYLVTEPVGDFILQHKLYRPA